MEIPCRWTERGLNHPCSPISRFAADFINSRSKGKSLVGGLSVARIIPVLLFAVLQKILYKNTDRGLKNHPLIGRSKGKSLNSRWTERGLNHPCSPISRFAADFIG
ncbi:hypothetical protein OROGR_011926 [Orobanche gracilis]